MTTSIKPQPLGIYSFWKDETLLYQACKYPGDTIFTALVRAMEGFKILTPGETPPIPNKVILYKNGEKAERFSI